ncbi:WD40-repeat-containing domain protein [Chytriomyces sp. MP71]|nr:WD40-repeat-containing domain protein [Chytriomyces sp. MP71]
MENKGRLKGHSTPVLSTALNQDGSHLASGASNAVVRIFDLASLVCSHSLSLPVAPSSEHQLGTNNHDHNFIEGDNEDQDIASLAWRNSHSLLAAVGCHLIHVDLRANPHSTPVRIFTANDCIADIALNPLNDAYISLADDTGSLSILDIRRLPTTTPPPKLFKSLSAAHSNMASACAYDPRPESNPWHVWSAGFDYTLQRWDTSNGCQVECIDLSSTTAAATSDVHEQGQIQSINPPFVYSLALSARSSRIAAGLGNGAVALLRRGAGVVPAGAKKKKTRPCVLDAVMPGVHAWSCTAVQFWDPDRVMGVGGAATETDNVGSDEVVVTGGLDGRVNVIGFTVGLLDENSVPAVKGTWNVERKVDSMICLGQGEAKSGRSVRIAVAGCPTAKTRDPAVFGAIDLWDIPV